MSEGTARLTGDGQAVRVRQSKGASPSHAHRESCVVSREAGNEALTAARAGGVMSTVILEVRSAETFLLVEGNIVRTKGTLGRMRMVGADSAVSETSGTYVRPEPGPGRSACRPGGSPPGRQRD